MKISHTLRTWQVSTLPLLAVIWLALILSGAQAAAPNKQEPAMRFEVIRFSSTACEPLCPEWISAEGQIKPDTAGKLAALLKNPAYRKLPIVLNSGGGSIEAALTMGRMIRKFQMTTTIGSSLIFGCVEAERKDGKCKLDQITKAYNGMAVAYRAYCASACPLVLLGGVVRVIDATSYVGLHEPRAEFQPYVDRYLIRYHFVHGHKQIVSREFVKRTYMARKEVVGVTPDLRKKLAPFLNEMGGDAQIITEMNKAAPKDMNWIKPGTGEREKLGLTSNGDMPVTTTFDTLTSTKTCRAAETAPANCILVKEKGPPILRPFERGN